MVKQAAFGFFLFGLLLGGCSSPTSDSTEDVIIEGLKQFQGKAVFMSDYASPGLVGFMGNSLRTEVVRVHKDTRLRWVPEQSRLFFIQRFESDSFFSLNLESGRLSRQISILRGKNVQDLLPISEKEAWVTARNSAGVFRVELSTGTVLSEENLARDQVDSDGFAEPTVLIKVGEFFATAFQRLTWHVPKDRPLIATWTQDGLLRSRDDIALLNPSTEFKKRNGHYYLGFAGVIQNGGVLDGGIVELDGSTLAPTRTVITEEELGGDIVDFEMESETSGWAIVSAPHSILVAFDPSSGKKLDRVKPVKATAYQWMQLLWEVDTLWVADQDRTAPRIRNFSAELKEREDRAVRLPLPPVQIIKIEK